MKKVVFEYINKKDEEICVLVNDEQDTLYKVNMNDGTVSYVQNIWSIDEILEDVRDELYISDSYVGSFIDYIEEQNIILNIKIYNERGEPISKLAYK